MADRSIWSYRNIRWLAGMLVASTGLAACITCLNLASRATMGLGGFFALGGPYEIANPAPEWVLLMPISILAGFAFGGLAISLSNKTGGFSLLIPVWSVLFFSLGWQFAVMGFNPPGAGIAWAWILCAVVFAILGFMPLPDYLNGVDIFGLGNTVPWLNQWKKPYDDPIYRTAYFLCVILGACAGLLIGLVLFRILAG